MAYLDRRDKDHDWAATQWAQIERPLLTCEAVLSEACFLRRKVWPDSTVIVELVNRGIVDVVFRFQDHAEPVAQLLHKYATIGMSLADACIVCMAELYPQSRVLTLDSDFRVYRKHGRQVVPVIMPDGR